jgi:hypothetical protein
VADQNPGALRAARSVTAAWPAPTRAGELIRAELSRLVRYDDESIVHDFWIRQRYDLGFASSYAPARLAAAVAG